MYLINPQIQLIDIEKLYLKRSFNGDMAQVKDDSTGLKKLKNSSEYLLHWKITSHFSAITGFKLYFCNLSLEIKLSLLKYSKI